MVISFDALIWIEDISEATYHLLGTPEFFFLNLNWQLLCTGMWWEQYGDSAPSLQRAAVRITSQVCSTLTFQRDWDIILQNHSEKRNKLDKEALADQAYVHYNLTLHSEPKTRKKLDGDPIALDGIDMTSPWVEDSDGPILTQWLDRFPSALDGGDLNTRQFAGSIFGPGDNLFGL